MAFLLAPLKRLMIVPFGLREIIDLPKGRLLDIGCGSGDMLNTAKSLGWSVVGLEIDPDAVRNAQSQGLNVVQGGYLEAFQMAGLFDCIVCSHVLEHVHHPNQLLDLLAEKLDPGGVLLLSLPNSKSHVREMFAENWRGLEAPRHLAIPSLDQIRSALTSRGFADINQTNVYFATYLESNRIKSRKFEIGIFYFLYYKIKQLFQRTPKGTSSDFIQIVAYKKKIAFHHEK
jgi:SAM-dependent methyltransferase